MMYVATNDAAFRISYGIHLSLSQPPTFVWSKGWLIAFAFTPCSSQFQQVAGTAEDIQKTCMLREEMPSKMSNNGTSFVEREAGMQETGHLAQFRIDGTPPLDLLNGESSLHRLLSHSSPTTKQEDY